MLEINAITHPWEKTFSWEVLYGKRYVVSTILIYHGGYL